MLRMAVVDRRLAKPVWISCLPPHTSTLPPPPLDWCEQPFIFSTLPSSSVQELEDTISRAALAGDGGDGRGWCEKPFTLLTLPPPPAQELEGTITRAALAGEGGGGALPAEVFWAAAQGKDRFRCEEGGGMCGDVWGAKCAFRPSLHPPLHLLLRVPLSPIFTHSSPSYSLLASPLLHPPAPFHPCLRLNLLSGYPLLRKLLRSDFWPNAINFK